MNKKLSLSMNRDFILGYPGAVDRKARTTCTTNSWALEKDLISVSFWWYQINGVIHHTIHNRGNNIERFNLFMEETSVAAEDNVQLTSLLDNASCHKRVAKAIIPGHRVVRHLPAYSVFEHL